MSEPVVKATLRFLRELHKSPHAEVLRAIHSSAPLDNALAALEKALDLHALPDNAIINSSTARQIAGGVSRETLSNWRTAGLLKEQGRGAQGGGFLYRAGDVRKAARSAKRVAKKGR